MATLPRSQFSRAELVAGARFFGGLRAFLKHPPSVEASKRIVAERLARTAAIAEATLRFGKLIAPPPLLAPAIDDHLHPRGPLKCPAELRIDLRSSDLHDDDPSRPFCLEGNGRAHDR